MAKVIKSKVSIGSALLTVCLSGCVTTSTDILSKFDYKADQQPKIESDLKTCEANAYNAGYTRRGGLLNEGGRVDFIEACMEKKQWAKK